MPLEDISPNRRKDVSSGGPKPGVIPAAQSTTSLRSSAVQSMLKTTTEIGDSGPFAVEPSRIPRSGSRLQSTRQRSGSFDASFASQLRHRRSPRSRYSHRYLGPRPALSSSGLSGHETSLSRAASSHTGLRSKRAGPRYRSQALAGLASPALGPQGLYAHRSLITLRSHRDVQSLHSGSPTVYPGHGRRHQTSSPAFTEGPHYGYGLRHGYPRVTSAATVASSPVSIYPGHPGLSGYRHEFTTSHPSFGRRPSPAVYQYPLNRTLTPLSGSLQNFRAIWNRSATSLREFPKSPTDSLGPHYYDYSESFLEEDCLSPTCQDAHAVPPHNMDQAVHENQVLPERRQAQSPFGTVCGSSFKPAELPTQHNRRASEQSKYSYSGVIPRRISSLAATSTPSNEAREPLRTSVQGNKGIANFTSDKDDPYRSCGSRRATVSPHAHSSAFFVNASRSPRDLTTLAARVHSPILDQRASTASLSGFLDHEDNNEDGDVDHSRGQRRSRSDWTLPSLSFRPFSISSQNAKDRPKTSGDTPSRLSRDILSPMPERPMSSQSRKRFSRILEIEDGYNTGEAKMTYQSFPGQTFARLTVVDEASDTQATDDGRLVSRLVQVPKHNSSCIDVTQSNFRTQQLSPGEVGDSQVTIHDKSTVESLLDRHIECLGLQESDSLVEVDGSSLQSQENLRIEAATASRTTMTLPHVLSHSKIRPSTSSSCRHTSIASSERHRLMPRRLFASMDARVHAPSMAGNLTTSPSRFSSTLSTAMPRSSGWQTLPSTTDLARPDDNVQAYLDMGELADIDSEVPVTKFKMRRGLTLKFSPSLPSQISSIPTREKDSNAEGLGHRRSKSDVVARQESHRRRRMRILLKTQRKSSDNYLPQAMGAEDRPREGLSPELALDDSWTTENSQNEAPVASPVEGYAELSADSVVAQPRTAETTGSVLLPSSFPKRWASVIAAMPEPVKKGIEIVRKASVRTIHSHRSNTSVIEPMNSTRQNSQLPRVGPVPQLGPPEFGPPLTSSDLNLSLRIFSSPQLRPIQPPLREVKSFFSDDSSAQHQRSVTRKRFDLHSFRSGMSKSTGVLGSRSQQPTPHSRCGLVASASMQMKGRKSFDYYQSNSGHGENLTDFQNRKRKVMERVKEWWKRQCMQKTLSLMKKRHGRNGRNGG